MVAMKCAISESFPPDGEGVRQAGRSPWRAQVADSPETPSRENPANGSDEVCDQ